MCALERTNRAWSGLRLPREQCDQCGYYAGTQYRKIWRLRSLLTLRPFDRNPVRKSTTVYRCRNKKFTSRRKFGDGIWLRLWVGRFAGFVGLRGYGACRGVDVNYAAYPPW